MIKYVFFDLDGTLLPMDQSKFTKIYFNNLAAKMQERGYDGKLFLDALMKGVVAMITNDGSKPNEQLFWDYMIDTFDEKILDEKSVIDEFYNNEFYDTKAACSCNPLVAEVLSQVKKMGLHAVLATNPVFPAVASEIRMQWGGAHPEDFEYITTYENSAYCKPNPEYFIDLMKKLGTTADECLMVGNDVNDDMSARKAGLKVFLLTDCLLNPKNEDISSYPQGGFAELIEYIKTL